MTRPKEPGYYYFDGKGFWQRKFMWESDDIADFFQRAYAMLAGGFRMVFDPNEHEGLKLVPGDSEKEAGEEVTTYNWVKTCPPLPPSECGW